MVSAMVSAVVSAMVSPIVVPMVVSIVVPMVSPIVVPMVVSMGLVDVLCISCPCRLSDTASASGLVAEQDRLSPSDKGHFRH